MLRGLRKNTIFKKVNIKTTTSPASSIYQSVKGYYYIDLEVTRSSVKAYQQYGINPIYNRGMYFLRARVSSKSKIFLDDTPILDLKNSLFDALSEEDLRLKYAILDPYGKRMQRDYECNCFANVLYLRRR